MILYNVNKIINLECMDHKRLFRFYSSFDESRIYLITTITKDRIPFFKNAYFKNIFKRILNNCHLFHKFKLYNFTIQNDHVHLLIEPIYPSDISKIMAFIKRNFSRNINQVLKQQIFLNDPAKRLNKQKYSEKQISSIKEHEKYLFSIQKYLDIPDLHFQWHKSFHDYVIRNKEEFRAYFDYINNNDLKQK